MSTLLRRGFLPVALTLIAVIALPNTAAAQNLAKANFKNLSVSFLPKDLGAIPQPPDQRRHEGFGVGILVGPFWDSISADDPEFGEFDKKTGLQFSLFLGGNRPGVFGVATELTLLRRKTAIGGETITFTTFQVPLLFRFNFGSANLDRAIFYLKFGPAIDILLKANSSVDGDIKDDVESFQVDVIIAGGVEITRFIFEVRWIKGIRAINKDFEDFTKIKSKAIALLFGIRFN
jgi:outer membrane protein with beta-barrel domain